MTIINHNHNTVVTNPSTGAGAVKTVKSFDAILHANNKGDRLSIVTNFTQESYGDDDHQDANELAVHRPPNPFVQASFTSKLLFIWPYKLMNKNAAAGPVLADTDLSDVLNVDSSAENLRKFHEMWEAEKHRAATVMEQHKANCDGKEAVVPAAYPSLHRAIAKDFLSTLWFVQPLMLASSVGKLVQALALGMLLESFDSGDGKGYLWAGVLVLSGFVVLLCHHQSFFWTWRKG